ncbi:MAG: PIG-L family deacetylase [Acidimicrobiales bacterium]|nr:PIG-L family deacetylase [Acidimicrobiales bacterium]
MVHTLEHFPEDWSRALVVVAHPDDMEYGGASAVARWTDEGKDVRYLLVTAGEAGIASMAPAEVGPLRMEEQRQSCAAVGVDHVEFLDHADGLVVADHALRRDLAAAIRRHRPDIVVSINFREDFGGPGWNHVDHREVGVALLDAVRDAANPWVFTELAADGLDAWDGVSFAAFAGSPRATHGVDVTDHLERGIESLRRHAVYLANLGGDMADPDSFLRRMATAGGDALGVQYASTFEVIPL